MAIYCGVGSRAAHRVDQLVGCGGTCPSRFKSSTWHGCSHFSEFISGFNDTMLLVVGDIPVDSEAPVVTS